VIEREPTPLRPPRPPEHGWLPADEDAHVELDSLLAPGELREGFSLARREASRPRRWLADLVGHHDAPPAAAPTHLAEFEERRHELDERELRALAQRDDTLREREQWSAGRREELEQRFLELESAQQKLEARERELVRREEAAARWFSELNRIQRLIEEKQQRLDGLSPETVS
jgi:hypothetical protein